jgi:hypothetical protein
MRLIQLCLKKSKSFLQKPDSTGRDARRCTMAGADELVKCHAEVTSILSREMPATAVGIQPVVGYFEGGFCDPPPEKQVPRARKKALGMTKIKLGHYRFSRLAPAQPRIAPEPNAL